MFVLGSVEMVSRCEAELTLDRRAAILGRVTAPTCISRGS